MSSDKVAVRCKECDNCAVNNGRPACLLYERSPCKFIPIKRKNVYPYPEARYNTTTRRVYKNNFLNRLKLRLSWWLQP